MFYKFKYNYSSIIEDIEEKIMEGMLDYHSIIQIQRSNSSTIYKPIIRWFYNERKMKEEERKEKKNTKEQIEHLKYIKTYYKYKNSLSKTTVLAVLIEMKEVNN